MGLAISLTKIYGDGSGTLSKLGLSSPNRKQTRACEAIKRNVMVLGNETGTKAAREVPHGGGKKKKIRILGRSLVLLRLWHARDLSAAAV